MNWPLLILAAVVILALVLAGKGVWEALRLPEGDEE